MEELKKIRRDKESELAGAPSGKIHIVNSGNRIQYYLRETPSDVGGTYLSKTQTFKISRYIQKSYDEKVLKLINEEIKVLERIVKKDADYVRRIRSLYSDYAEEIKKYIEPIDLSDEDYGEIWRNKPYKGKEIPEYLPVYETKQKERVRSKSELNIANTLADRGIPYRYECPLILSTGMTIYPDFTVLNRRTRKNFYWEHRGMMDDKEYARNSVSRLKELMREGLFVGNELIITEETSTSPLGTNEIEAIIERFFL